MIKKVSITFILILGIVFLVSCTNNQNSLYQTDSFNMGTIISQSIHGENAEIAADDVKNIIQDIETKMTSKANVGEINQINKSAGNGDFISVSNETFYLLEKSKNFYTLSNGAFDISVGPIVKLWGIGTPNAHIPTEVEINQKLKLINSNHLVLNGANTSARLMNLGQEIDLGAIAKGYAADQAIKIYKKHGIRSALINLGGNVAVLGSKPDGTKWNIGIQNPRKPSGNYVGILNISDKSVVTSGDYERFFIENNKRYHHIFDPVTGYPADTDLMSVTIIAELSTNADALSTSAFVLGFQKGRTLIESIDNVDAIFITKDKNIYVTSGIENNFVFDDESKEFSYAKER